MKGSTLPRVYTQPLLGRRMGDGPAGGCPCGCALTPETSEGFAVVKWAQSKAKGLGVKLHPWQKWLLIHALEKDGDLYRFRTVLVLVARQNGKTLLKMVLTLWRLYERKSRLIVGTAQDRQQAKEVMNEGLVPMMLEHEVLRERFDPDEGVGVWHKTLGEEYFRIDSEFGPRHIIKTLNEQAGRGLWNVAEVNIDEMRTQRTFGGWASVSKVVMAAENAQTWGMSNAGDSKAVLLNHLRSIALAGDDDALFHAEWSGEPGCELDDVNEWAQANPSMGYKGGPTERSIRSAMLQDPPGVFRTEVLCQFVDVLDRALDQSAWIACADPTGGAAAAGRPAVVIESAVEAGQVVAVSAEWAGEERVRLNVVGVWGSSDAARAGIAEIRSALRPAAMGWFPKGPGAPLSAAMRKANGIEIKGEKIAEACMTFADYVDGRRLLHPDDPILNSHVNRVGSVGTPQVWMFDRGPGETHAAWAAAGALHLVLNGAVPMRKRRKILTGSD